MGKITFKVVGNGQMYVERNRSPVGTAFSDSALSGIDFQTGDSIGMVLIPYMGSYVISLCDFPKTECRTESSYYFNITDGNAVPQMMIATFSTTPPSPPVVTPPPVVVGDSTVNTLVTGNNVMLTVNIGTGERLDWWIRVISKYDYGYGKGQGVGDYPWIVEVINGTTQTANFVRTYKPGMYAAELNIMGKGPVDYSTFELAGGAPTVQVPKAAIFNWCWKVGMPTGSCPMPRDSLAIPAGSAVVIQADIANYGYSGKVRAVIKVDGSQIVSQDNASLVTYTDKGTIWNVRTTYTMPNKDVALTVEAYSWDGSTWILTDNKADTISTSAAGCNNISLDPLTAPVNPAVTTSYKVTLTATVAPTGSSFPVMFKSGNGTVLGTCNSDKATGTCSYVWDYSTMKSTYPDITYSDGTSGYYITAIVGTSGTIGACTSTRTTIVVGNPIVQHTMTIVVNDEKTGVSVSGATVSVATAGTAAQSKTTDISGRVSFKVDDGTVSITISKGGYNTINDAKYSFVDNTFVYSLPPVPAIPIPGSVQFVSVPSGAGIYIDGKDTGQKTPKTIDGLSSGPHSYVLRLTGYNDTPGTMNVVGGSTIYVYLTLPALTPTTGSLNITSHPVMGAKIYVDGVDTKKTTSASATVTDLAPGNHEYRLVLNGYEDSIGTFVVVAGQNTPIDAEMVPLSTIGSLEITSTPSGAEIFVDGIDTNRTTGASILNLDVGRHEYKLTLNGYQTATGNFNIDSGIVTTVDVILTKITPTTGTLAISSVPSNAKVFIDSKDVNKVTPAIIDNLVEGSHSYSLTLVGYKDVGAIVSIVAGFTKVVNVNLEQTAVAPPSGAGMGTVALVGLGIAAAVILSGKENK